MAEREYIIKTKDNGYITVIVSEEFGLIKLDPETGHDLTLDLYDFKFLAEWVFKTKIK